MQEIKQNAAKAEQSAAEMNAKFEKTNADLTAIMNAKFEQITANAEINNAELTAKIDAQKSSLTETLEHSNADVNLSLIHISTTHMYFTRQTLISSGTNSITWKKWHSSRYYVIFWML